MLKKFTNWFRSYRKNRKLKYLSRHCPNFYKDMPPNDDFGTWEVGACVYSNWHHFEVGNTRFFGSLHDAYILAREVALNADRSYYPVDELGVSWFIRKIV